MNKTHNAALKYYYKLRRQSWNAWAPKSRHDRAHRYLTESQYREIMALVSSGETMAQVARTFGLNYSTVTKIVYGTLKPKINASVSGMPNPSI